LIYFSHTIFFCYKANQKKEKTEARS